MGKIKKLKSNELIGGVDREDVYPITSTKAVFDDSNTSQDDINKNRLERIEDLEETMPTTVKSITINGGTKTYLPEDGNVELTIYSPGGEDYPGIAEAVQTNTDNITAIQNEIGTDTTEDTLSGRIKSLENAVGTGGSVDQKIEDAINDLDSQIVVNYGEVNPHIRGAVQLADGKLTRFELEENDIASASNLQALDEYTHSIYQTKIEAVSTRPTTGEAGIIYRVPNSGGTTYTDWMYSDGWKELATFNIATLNASDVNYDNSTSGLASNKVQGALDEVADEIGVKAVLETYNGNDYTLSSGFINNNGEAVVPSNNDWGKTGFIPLPSGANCFSFENCAGYHVISDIVFYSSNDEQSVVAKYGDYQQQQTVRFWDIPITYIPSEAAYYRLTFVLKIGSSVQDIALQKITFYNNTSIKTTVEKLDENIGVSYPPYNVSIKKSINVHSATNYEYLYIGKGTQITITQNGNAPLDVYYCPNSQVWDRNDYQTIGRVITENPYTYTFPQNAGCVRIFNDGTSIIDVTITLNKVVTAQEQITINRQTIDRIVEKVGGIEDSFAQTLEFREPVTGSLAKLWTSNTLTQASKEKEWLVIMCHGNGILIDTYDIPSTALDYFRANKINVATIQYQDLNNTGIVGAGFNKYAWGNDSQFAHVICLYNYLQSHYNFHKSVVLAGCSMGGLAMGAFAYKKPFPIAFCLGIGSVPSLMTFWNNGNESRKSIIRAAYNMPTDGSDDANAATYFQGHDWWNMGMLAVDNVSYKIGFPNVYLYYGNDAVFRDLFGGTAKYNELCQALKNGGIYSKVEQVGANNTVHDTPTIWTQSVVENVWHNELGVPSYAE